MKGITKAEANITPNITIKVNKIIKYLKYEKSKSSKLIMKISIGVKLRRKNLN